MNMGFLFRVAGRHTCNAACGGEEDKSWCIQFMALVVKPQSNCFTMLVHKADKLPPLNVAHILPTHNQCDGHKW